MFEKPLLLDTSVIDNFVSTSSLTASFNLTVLINS